MSKTGKRVLIGMMLCTLMVVCLPAMASANSAEPPSLVILINNPPADLSIVMISNENQRSAIKRQVAWEGYYVFYSRDMQDDDEYTFKITTNGESFECTLDAPLQGYNNVVTLDIAGREFNPGTYSFRSVLLVSIRLLLTLLLEGIVFWFFGFRQKSSWLAFLAINLITQGALNIWLNSGDSLMPGYLILGLLVGEFFVFTAEMIAFPFFIKEHKVRRIVIYTFTANAISLLAGSYLITVLPV